MGLFKNLRAAVKNVGAIVDASREIQAQQDQIESGAPYDATDPAFAPIEGVDCDTYARVMGGIGRNGLMGAEAIDSYAAENGIKMGTWLQVQLGWTQRMQQYPQVAQRIGILISQGMR